ncbi:hypothetical protein RS030_213245 [Cryptosporidium xiaoi]|uniref:Uncharacterized protein n=1 Tax=Cryptosporidium xiaoi TaxID=659607 RepID=A0AAV9XXB4_9CRYT
MKSFEEPGNEYVSTPRHLKSLDEDLVVFAPDARKTNKIWDDLESAREDEAIFLEMPKSVFIGNSDSIIETKNSNTMPIINVPRLSIGNRLLLTPEFKHSKSESGNIKFFRESILSTGIPRDSNDSYRINLNYETLTTNDNDSDIESLFEINTYNIDNQEFSCINDKKILIDSCDLLLGVGHGTKQSEQNVFAEVNTSPISSSLGKRQRSSPSIHSGADSPFELIHIMKKSLKLS